MADDLMRDEYNEYLSDHCKNVLNAYIWLASNIPGILKDLSYEEVLEKIQRHDSSKWDSEEYFPYCEYFYGTKTEEVNSEFDKAWLRHQNKNDHHWNYWVLVKDSGEVVPLEMPYICVLEMLCDHWSFSWKTDNLSEIFDWYKDHKSRMLLHPNTRKVYEGLLDELKKVLEERLYVSEE